MESQCKMILAYMENRGSITSMDAFRDLGITRLSARIKDLRTAGVEVVTVMEQKNNSRYARYHIKKEQTPDKETAL